MNEMQWDSGGRMRKMRKADQFRFNEKTGCFEIYQIDVPAELEEWEKEGLEKQTERRAKRKAKQMDEIGSETENGRDSELSD